MIKTVPEHFELNFTSVAAWKKLAPIDSSFRFYSVESVGPDLLMTGAPVIGEYKTGPRKGCPKFDTKRSERIVVTDAEVEAAEREYSMHFGLCCKCLGSGQECCGWSRDEGARYKTCRKCNGTGKAT